MTTFLHKNYEIKLLFPKGIDDQRILQSDWTRATTNHNQMYKSQTLPCRDDYLHAKNLRYRLIHLRDTNDKKILQSDWLIAL